jgi:long-chain acyl-CoA synthetase
MADPIHRWDVGPMRHEAKYGDRIVPCYVDRPASVAALIDEAIAARGEHDALVSGALRLSWRGLGARSGAAAGRLQREGIAQGDRVAILLANGAPFIVALLAVLQMGGVVVPVNIREQRGEIAHILNDSGAAAVLYGPEIEAQLPGPTECPGVRLWADQAGPLFSDEVGQVARVDVGEDDLAFIFYTSGTTGRPKGVMLTHANIVHSAMNYAECLGLSPEDRMLVAVPMSHVTGMTGMVAAAIRARATLVVMESFNVADSVALAAAERISHTILVPAMYNLILLRADLASVDLSAWRVGGYGGAPMPSATIERLAEALPALGLWNLYGATETASPAAMLPPRFALSHRDSVGLPSPGATLVIMGEGGREVPIGEVGEIWIGGPTVARGYWNNPDATRQGFAAGFWKSGDIGSVDAEGFVRVLDRAKDLINRGGYKIFSAEVEAVLVGHHAVIEAAIVPKYCPVLGERVHAFVTVRETIDIAADLDAFVAGHLADYKRPESWTIRTTPLPRNANGKILKRALREEADRLFPPATGELLPARRAS